MKSRLSELLDGELELHETDGICRQLRDKPDLRECGRLYALIGDALRGESALGIDITASVMAQLEAEPVILARRSHTAAWQRPLMALAASAAGIAVAAWLVIPIARQSALDTVAQAGPAQTAVKVVASLPATPTAPSDMQEYVIAHQAQSANLQFQGGSEHIRTVSLDYGK